MKGPPAQTRWRKTDPHKLLAVGTPRPLHIREEKERKEKRVSRFCTKEPHPIRHSIKQCLELWREMTSSPEFSPNPYKCDGLTKAFSDTQEIYLPPFLRKLLKSTRMKKTGTQQTED